MEFCFSFSNKHKYSQTLKTHPFAYNRLQVCKSSLRKVKEKKNYNAKAAYTFVL